jgi:tetratricopeptide (TPR) repeat protein
LALSNLATIHFQQDKIGTAVKEYTEALDILEKELAPDHPKVATLLNNLAQVYLAQDNLKQAEPLFERALEIKQDRLGRSTPESHRSSPCNPKYSCDVETRSTPAALRPRHITSSENA